MANCGCLSWHLLFVTTRGNRGLEMSVWNVPLSLNEWAFVFCSVISGDQVIVNTENRWRNHYNSHQTDQDNTIWAVSDAVQHHAAQVSFMSASFFELQSLQNVNCDEGFSLLLAVYQLYFANEQICMSCAGCHLGMGVCLGYMFVLTYNHTDRFWFA